MYSEKNRQIVLHIRELFSRKGEMPEYDEALNAIVLVIRDEFKNTYPLLISHYDDVLFILSLKDLEVKRSEEVLKHILNLNWNIKMGCFFYSLKKNICSYKLSIPLPDEPTKEFMERVIAGVCRILDKHTPEILSHSK